jgi:uncharacterized membrane protein
MLTFLLCTIIGLAGALLLSYGFWMIMPALGFITGGVLCLMWSWMAARAAARSQTPPSGDQ